MKDLGLNLPLCLQFGIWVDNKLSFVCIFPKEKGNEKNTICALCAKPASSFCSQCKLVAYCSKNCQSTHWKAHKIHCNKYFKDQPTTKSSTSG